MSVLGKRVRSSYYEASARERILGLVDSCSFHEYADSRLRLQSPHLGQLDMPGAFDDGIIVGEGTVSNQPILILSQEGFFMGGAVGEVHGAKFVGLLERAQEARPHAVLLLIDSGGVRLHEANAGLIGISEILRALLSLRALGVPVIGVVGGKNGSFGGMGIVARCCDHIIMSEEGRLSISGPEVIETVKGVEEFDSRDRALVWRTTGGKHRYIIGEADSFVEDSMEAFRTGVLNAMRTSKPMELGALEDAQKKLQTRLDRFGSCGDAQDIWTLLGIDTQIDISMMDEDEFLSEVRERRISL